MKSRGWFVPGVIVVLGTTALGGCVYRTERVPAASPSTTTVVVQPGAAASQRVYSYPEGRWELRGEGTTAVPYVWVWIPAGATPPNPPPLPR